MALRNTSIAVIMLLGLGAIAAFTNPGEQGYKRYTSTILKERLEDEVCPEIAKDLGPWLEGQCYILVNTTSPYLAEAIAQQTKRQNFVIFSIYQADLPLPSPLPSYQIATIGILGKFYTYQAREL